MGNDKISRRLVLFTNVVFSCGILISLLLVLYFLYRIIYPIHTTSSYYYLLVGVLIVVAVFGVMFRLADQVKVASALSFVSVLAVLYFVECYLQIVLDYPLTNEKRAAKLGIPWDTRTKFQVVKYLRANDVDAYTSIGAWSVPGKKFYTDDLVPLGSISNKTIVYCNEGGERTVFVSDKYGFNNPQSVYEGATVDIAIFGDSYTEGACVRAGEDIGSVLRKSGWNVANFGRAGSGPLHQLATAIEYGIRLDPTVFLWIWTETNDLTNLQKELTSVVLERYMTEEEFSQNLIERQDEIDYEIGSILNQVYVKREKQEIENIKRKIQRKEMPLFRLNELKLFKIIKLVELRKLVLANINKINTGSEPEISSLTLEKFEVIVRKFKEAIEKQGGVLYFVFSGADQQNNISSRLADVRHQEIVRNTVRRYNIPAIDIGKEVLDQHPEPETLIPPLGGHYNAVGYRLIGEAIGARLVNDGVIEVITD